MEEIFLTSRTTMLSAFLSSANSRHIRANFFESIRPKSAPTHPKDKASYCESPLPLPSAPRALLPTRLAPALVFAMKKFQLEIPAARAAETVAARQPLRGRIRENAGQGGCVRQNAG